MRRGSGTFGPRRPGCVRRSERASDTGFDPEFPISFDDHFKIPTKNATHLLSFQTSDLGVTPTKVLVADAVGAPLSALYRMEMSPATLTEVQGYETGQASLRRFNDAAHLLGPPASTPLWTPTHRRRGVSGAGESTRRRG